MKFILLELILLIKMLLLNVPIELSVIMSVPFLLVLLSTSSFGHMYSFIISVSQMQWL